MAWLLKIAHNVCLTRRRSTRRRGRVEAVHDIDSMQDFLPAPEHESTDELIRLDDALAQMPESQRRAIVLREWQGLSYAEIARELKVTQSAVETLIFRARRSLATNLESVFDRPRVLARARHAVELGWLLNGLRALFEGGAAVKAATAAVAISSATVLATSTGDAPRHAKTSASTPVAVVERPVVSAERPRLAERELTVVSTAETFHPRTAREGAAKPKAATASAAVSLKTPHEKKVKANARGAERGKRAAKTKPAHRTKLKREKPLHVAPRITRTPHRTKPKKHASRHAEAPAPAPAAPAPEEPAPPAKDKQSGKSK